MVVFPPCKINLGLQVVSKRPDGFHDLITCFYPVPWYDILEIIPAENFSFSSSGIPIPGTKENNLCIKAYELLKKDWSLPCASIHLHKIIPMGAGLGGGSSDAAWTLTTLNKIFNVGLSADQLFVYASKLGSDCPFFIQDRPKIGMGKGDVLTDISIDLHEKFIILIKPPIHVSTAEAYADVVPGKQAIDLKNVLEKFPVQEWKTFLRNDFEPVVFRKYPEIAGLKESLYDQGALFASMSGSGSAVFGIFSEEKHFKKNFAGMSYWSGWL